MDYIFISLPTLIMVLSFIEYISGNFTDAIYVAMVGLFGILLVMSSFLIEIIHQFESKHQKDK